MPSSDDNPSRITPPEVEETLTALRRALESLAGDSSHGIDRDRLEPGLAEVALDLVGFLRRLLECRASARMEGVARAGPQDGEIGATLLQLEEEVRELITEVGFKPEERRRMLEVERFAATGRLAGAVAHEINNPMEAIKNAIYLLAGKVSPDAAPVYDILRAEAERMARIVRQMLGLYRSAEQAGSVDVNGVIQDTLLLLKHQLERAGITVTTDLATLPAAVGSPDQLRQVLLNLVVNARDSMERGGTLHIRTRSAVASDPPRTFIRILVADSGSGIPKALQETIFEPFVSTKGEKGTGLGLWIVKGIIEKRGGRISLRSRVGSGTVFKIDLPAVP
jgi:signal transduction histidine kinase